MRQDEVLSTIRGITSLGEDRERLDERIEVARLRDIGTVDRLESEKRNVERRLEDARTEVDELIASVIERSPARITKLRLAESEGTSSLTEDEIDFLKILVIGESKTVNAAEGRTYVGLRATDLIEELAARRHPTMETDKSGASARKMLGELERRGFAFRTGPSLHRVRKPFVKEFQDRLEASAQDVEHPHPLIRQ